MDWTQWWSEYLQNLEKVTEPLIRQNKSLLESIERILTPPEFLDAVTRMQRAFSPAIDQAVELATEMSSEEFKRFEAEMGWLEFLPMPTFWNLYLLSKEDDIKRAWEKLISDFTQEDVLDWLLKDLSGCTLFQKRREIIERGLNHHQKGDWISSVSVLLPQVEGLIWDMGAALGLVDANPNSRAKLDKNGGVVLHTSGKYKGNPVEWTVGELVAHLWDQKDFENYFASRVYTSEFRHPILHGRRVDLFSEKESTAVLLYLKVVKERCFELGLC